MKFLPEIAEVPPDAVLEEMGAKCAQLEAILKRLTDGRKKYPEGRLRIHNDKNPKYIEYYHVTKNAAGDGSDASRRMDASRRKDAIRRKDAGCGKNTGNTFDALDKKISSGTLQKYISKNNIDFAKRLAQKSYDEKVEKFAENALKALAKACKTVDAFEKAAATDSISKPRAALISAITKTDQEYAAIWQSHTYAHKQFYEDAPAHFTQKNERVRSKSEVLIADTLSRFEIPYHYEYPVKLKCSDGTYQTLHPDFIVLDPHTRREYLWEHLGMLDDPAYLTDALSRYNLYLTNGIFPGRNLIYTIETKSSPLQKSQIEMWIKKIKNP